MDAKLKQEIEKRDLLQALLKELNRSKLKEYQMIDYWQLPEKAVRYCE